VAKNKKNSKKKPSSLIKKTNKSNIKGVKGVGVRKKRKYTKRKGVRYGRPIRLKGQPKAKPNQFILFKNRVYKLLKDKPYALPYFDKRFNELMRLLWAKKKLYDKNEKVPFSDSEIIYFSDEFFGASEQVSSLLDNITNSQPYHYYDVEELLERLSLIEANLKIHIQEFTTKEDFIFPHEIVRDERVIYEEYFQSWMAWANLVHHHFGWTNTDAIRMFVRASDWCYDEEKDYYHIEIILCDIEGNPNSFGFYPNKDEYYTIQDFKNNSEPNFAILEICNCNKKLYQKTNEKGEKETSYDEPDFSDLKDDWEWCVGKESETETKKELEKTKKELEESRKREGKTKKELEETKEKLRQTEIELDKVKKENEELKQRKYKAEVEKAEEEAKKTKIEREEAEERLQKTKAERKKTEIHELANRVDELRKVIKIYDEMGDNESASMFRKILKNVTKKLSEKMNE